MLTATTTTTTSTEDDSLHSNLQRLHEPGRRAVDYTPLSKKARPEGDRVEQRRPTPQPTGEESSNKPLRVPVNNHCHGFSQAGLAQTRYSHHSQSVSQ